MSAMKPQASSVTPVAARTPTFPVLEMSPPAVNKLGETVLTETHSAEMQSWAGAFQSTLNKHISDQGQQISDLQAQVAALQKQLSAK